MTRARRTRSTRRSARRREHKMKVREVMAKDPVTIDPEAAVGSALDVMRTKHVRHLPVVDEAGALMGIITDRDLRHAAFAPAVQEYLSVRARRLARQLGETLENLRVRDVMTWAVVTTGPETPVLSAALIMFESRVGSLPVIERGRLVGLITEQDILKALMMEGKVAEFVGGYMW
jgi:acetoin utilization protein AcuB